MADVVFALVVDGKVTGTLVYPEHILETDASKRHIAALRAPHEIVEATGTGATPGWNYDGSQFTPPVEE